MSYTTADHKAILPLARGIGLLDCVVKHLHVAILDGSVQVGDPFVGQRLTAQLGVSATAVREAVIELATLGFVKLLPKRDAVCREFGPMELREIFPVRRILKAEAGFGACGRVPAEQLQELFRWMLKLSETGETDPMWSDQAMAADLELHGVVRQRCSNRQLAHQIERNNVLMRTIHCVAGNLYNVQLRTVSEHLRIIEALLAKGADLARKRTSEHIERTARGVAKVMFHRTRGIIDS